MSSAGRMISLAWSGLVSSFGEVQAGTLTGPRRREARAGWGALGKVGGMPGLMHLCLAARFLLVSARGWGRSRCGRRSRRCGAGPVAPVVAGLRGADRGARCEAGVGQLLLQLALGIQPLPPAQQCTLASLPRDRSKRRRAGRLRLGRLTVAARAPTAAIDIPRVRIGTDRLGRPQASKGAVKCRQRPDRRGGMVKCGGR